MTREQKPLPPPTQHFVRGAREINAVHLAKVLGTDNLPRGQQITIAGSIALPIDYTNKTVVLLGLPGCGKTAALHGTQRSLAPVYLARPGRLREFVIDPAGVYWLRAALTLPPGVPMLNLSPHLEGATILDIAATVDNDPSAANNVVSAFMGVDEEGGGEAKESDPFWSKKARALLFMLVTVFIRRAKGRWRFADLVVPFRWPEFLAPVLAQTTDTRASAAYEIAGKMGKGIVASASAELNELCIVAAYSQRATRTFTFREMMRRSAYMHICYDPGIAGGYARYASALTRLLELACYAHGSEHNRTIVMADEGRELRNLHLPRIAARGRQAGMGVILAAQTYEGLVAKWGEKQAREALGQAGTFVCFAASPDTAEYFSKLVGQQEVIEVTFNDGVSVNSGSTCGDSTTYSANTTHINHDYKWEEPLLSLNTWLTPQHRDQVGEGVGIGISKAHSFGGSQGTTKSTGRANRLAVRGHALAVATRASATRGQKRRSPRRLLLQPRGRRVQNPPALEAHLREPPAFSTRARSPTAPDHGRNALALDARGSPPPRLGLDR